MRDKLFSRRKLVFTVLKMHAPLSQDVSSIVLDYCPLSFALQVTATSDWVTEFVSMETSVVGKVTLSHYNTFLTVGDPELYLLDYVDIPNESEYLRQSHQNEHFVYEISDTHIIQREKSSGHALHILPLKLLNISVIDCFVTSESVYIKGRCKGGALVFKLNCDLQPESRTVLCYLKDEDHGICVYESCLFVGGRNEIVAYDLLTGHVLGLWACEDETLPYLEKEFDRYRPERDINFIGVYSDGLYVAEDHYVYHLMIKNAHCA